MFCFQLLAVMGVEKRQALPERKWWTTRELENRIRRFLISPFVHSQLGMTSEIPCTEQFKQITDYLADM